MMTRRLTKTGDVYKRQDSTRIGFKRSGHNVHQSGFPGAVFTDQAQNLPFFQRQTHLLERCGPAEAFADILQLDHDLPSVCLIHLHTTFPFSFT